ncbi:hypothetical protein [Acinetobacter baumannii]|uniref:hypothetical protein n=1 Tax=Acinetobacter baumannii TaxID=470 RepID=UPI001C2DECEF|nr:hypothetical protein [Acinetobacter baumannii]QXF07462.1 hypothetical protein IAG34_13420 [Acinetobacter baumannii]
MDNYKIKVNDEAESKEAQELFFELGYIVVNHVDNEKGFIVVSKEADSPFNFGYWCSVDKELTLPQLRDLVVLKRNDVRDANHRDKRDESIYLTSDKVIYYWQGEWCKSAINKSNDYENYIANSLTLIVQPQDPDLISGADAMIAAIDGKDVEYEWIEGSGNWRSFNDEEWSAEDLKSGGYRFRLKPQTIKVELELPKPFEPKVGQEVWFIDDNSKCGYSRSAEYGSDIYSYFGWWRTEDEIKQVVEQLRKIRGTNS